MTNLLPHPCSTHVATNNHLVSSPLHHLPLEENKTQNTSPILNPPAICITK